MKRLFLSLCLLFTIGIGIITADSYTVAISTYLPTIADPAATWPNIDGPAKIGDVIITNSGATVQTVTFYKLSESSTTATAIGYAVLATTGTQIVDFNGEAYTDLGVVKSATATTVTITVFYE